MVFSDPPYNVPIEGHVSGNGEISHPEFAMASGEMSKAEFIAFLASVFGHLVAHSVSGAIHFQCIDWRHVQDMLTAAEGVYGELKNLCIWAKNNAGMGSFYRSQHELVCVFKSGAAPHINNIQLGKHGRNRTNVWNYAGVNAFGESRSDLQLHPTVKPVAMVEDAIRDCSRRNGIILDPFLGSGTTLIAAERTGRIGYGIEIDPHYCDVALRRLKAVCGLDVVLGATSEPFETVALRRKAPPAAGFAQAAE
ncbi:MULTISPECIES: site-specific DNA-methyltransferase [unclassified Bradyrhizobium]|uniref:DNA-methyltransferase n=1 Tax=unclassified Bradyrhizobium TaxID=2631580 RepID=UPI00247AFC82|nr:MULTISPECIES: site-specific DNA-methyltransferase [unclassified Bradyrhizobium]WGR73901.1 site-specific DNA-methyltransferase [Bradyrhizobium sp. ISRA426]WGR78738.1 site-specific DNA-methyltransferase [Bradyrhizobium sp. ISRA430]WGR89140.1 site-specific DNA-methyltransferase [Bradyrhizobium sp. ISRA432]